MAWTNLRIGCSPKAVPGLTNRVQEGWKVPVQKCWKGRKTPNFVKWISGSGTPTFSKSGARGWGGWIKRVIGDKVQRLHLKYWPDSRSVTHVSSPQRRKWTKDGVPSKTGQSTGFKINILPRSTGLPSQLHSSGSEPNDDVVWLVRH